MVDRDAALQDEITLRANESEAFSRANETREFAINDHLVSHILDYETRHELEVTPLEGQIAARYTELLGLIQRAERSTEQVRLMVLRNVPHTHNPNTGEVVGTTTPFTEAL